MEVLNRDGWQRLSAEDKEEWMRKMVRELPDDMQYEGLASFERFGQRMETGVFTHEGERFVFVPGDHVTLGWDRWLHGMNKETSADLHETVSEYGVEDVDSFLASQMSPVREVQIVPMLVECETISLGWIEVSEEEAFAQENPDFSSTLEQFKQSEIREYELHQHFRLIRQEEGEVRILWFNEGIELEDVVREEAAAGFGLLTEDEWEYIYGGGCRTLFPWGDSFDYTMKLKHYGALEGAEENVDQLAEPDSLLVEEEDHPYDLELPNFFGVRFAGDPYKYELTLDTAGDVMPKGGDGGSLICGGTGPLVGFLPAAAVYYRDGNASELDWEELMDTMYYRRVFRLTGMALQS
ncbi:hypothetical protein C0Q44_09615 [Paenibacillus sp. PCH8]|uniref:hypothetical protein n=1 Tax=Paenibacillus sp. PCH8 TaxID=2066524 RepID=UPI000CFA7D76|nr:hypothetical protein [Paenibacillus sp. PCH8]PQP84763.1 hypothetical protein C0Q44_09615 [Paenibacillus sp. PCH8]